MVPLLALCAWALVACGEETAVPEEPAASEAAVETAVPPTDEPATPEPIVVPTLIAEIAAVDSCLECHTDKDRLIDTADPEEEVITENEGEG